LGNRIVEFYRSFASMARALDHNRRLFARLSAFVIWSLVAATAVFWALRFGVRAPQAPAYAVPIDRSVPPRGDLTRLFGAAPLVALAAPEVRPEAPSRFRLVGVMAPRSSTAEGTGAYGLALIAVDGKPPRAFSVGARLDSDLVLQSVGLRTASLGSAQGPRTVLLELPALPPPATGVLPAPGAPTAVPPVVTPMMRPNPVPVPAAAPVMAPVVPQTPVMQPQAVPAPVPGSGNQLPPNSNLPQPDNFRSQ
jgi:general secretion pathway protein C